MKRTIAIISMFTAAAILLLLLVTVGQAFAPRMPILASATIPAYSPNSGVSLVIRGADKSYSLLRFGLTPPYGLLSSMQSLVHLFSIGFSTTGPDAAGPAGVGRASQLAALGDFKGDGSPGVAYTDISNNSSNVTVYIGTSMLAFNGAANYPAGPIADGVITGDFNRDGKVDLAVSYQGGTGTGGVAVLLNTGNGTFGPAKTYSFGQNPSSVATFDVNGDGILDLVVADGSSFPNSVYVLTGKGDGTFNAAVGYATSSNSLSSVTIGDFDGDGHPDLATTAYDSTVSILLNNGSGAFHLGSSFMAGNLPIYIAAGDVNGDGKLDLVTADTGDSAVSVFLGDGHGHFQLKSKNTLSDASSLILTDYNNDGKLDIINALGDARGFGPSFSNGNIDVILGNGDGTFQGSSGAGSTAITFQTTPTGLLFTVDGGAVLSAPQTMNLSPGSHTIAVNSVQAGDTGIQYSFTGWNDGGLPSHSIVVGGSAATYTASFTAQYQLTTAASPVAGGTVTPASGTFFNAGMAVPISATANQGYAFANWSGAVASSTSASTTVTMNGAETVTANFAPVGSLTIQTSPPGLQFSVDGGTAQTAPQTLSVAQGAHTIAIVGTQAGATGTQYVFTSWNDGGAASHSVNVTSTAATYTATFKTQYLLTTAASPVAGGTVTPASGTFYDMGSSVPVSATANSGFTFANWTGPVASASSASTNVAMSAPATVTANFSSLTGITIQTSPTGLQFTVDGGNTQVAPQTLNLPQGPHTIAVVGTQPGATGTQYVFTSWSDGGAASHSINVANAAATFTATFKTQYLLTTAASPVAGGTVSPTSGTFYDMGASVPVSAAANSGFTFANWTGPVASASSASTSVTMSAPAAVTANFSSLTGITIQTSPTGLQFTVDGGNTQIAPQTLNLPQGPHTIAVVGTQPGATGTQYVFTSWSDGGAASHSINVANAAATFTATFKTQYLLTTAASPVGGGTVSPASGTFYDMGASVPVSATANTGFTFTNWTGPVASASSASTSVTMSAPATVTANFSSLTGITIQTSPSGLQFSVDGGNAQTAPQTLNLSQGAHTIAVVGTQAGATATQYVFTSWNDGGAASHSINVTNAAATFTATFKTQYQLTTAASPVAGGTVSPTSGTFYDMGASVTVSATANTGFTFANWTGPVASASSASSNVTMSGPATVTANFLSQTGITIQTIPAGLQFSLDGGAVQTAPQTLTLSQGPHVISVAGTQAGTAGTQYVFTSWTDGGAASHSINVTNTAATFTANFKTQYLLTTAASPVAGGTVTPATGAFYDSGTAVPLSATANSGYSFTAWTGPVASAANAATTITMNAPSTVTANFAVGTPSGLAFYPVTPCRLADTRGNGFSGDFGAPTMAAGATHDFPIPASACHIPAGAQAYSLNVTAVPVAKLTYLSIWPAGQPQPVVSTLNSFDGQIVANAAIVPAGGNGAISVFVSDATDVIIDINGYFAPPSAQGLAFYPVTPCRVADTRSSPSTFGGPTLPQAGTRSFPIPQSSCHGIPAGAQAYSLNMTVVPTSVLNYLSAWPSGETQPVVSTLNSLNGRIVANAAIVPAGNAGGVSVYVSDGSDVIVDINGYFAPAGGVGALYFHPATPCRIADTRNSPSPFGGPFLTAQSTRDFSILNSSCGLPAGAQAYALNMTVVPREPLTYLTTWPTGQSQPVVSTLNSLNTTVVANAAVVPAGSAGSISVFVSNATDLIIDANGYFAP